MVEALTKEMPQTIATKSEKGAKKANANISFADFIKDLGKTTEPTKSVESNISNPNDIPTKSNKNSNLNTSNEVKKTEILSNLLKGKTQEVKSEKNIQSPLDSILQRPKATHTKLNVTPEIKQPKESSESQTERFSNRDAILRSLKGTNISFEDSPQNSPQFIKTTETNTESANKVIPSVSDLENAGQNMAKNSTNDANSQSMAAKSDLAKDSPKDLSPKNVSDSRPQSQNVTTNQTINQAQNMLDSQNPLESQDLQKSQHTKPSVAQSAILNDTPKTENNTQNKAQNPQDLQNNKTAQSPNATNDSELPNVAQLLKDAPQDSTPTQNNTVNTPLTQNQAPSVAQKPLDLEDLQEVTPNIAQDKSQSFTKLGITNTLKYGAFKAFDALSLLKPSDGKKLSELIKKADELSLNLQSVKYTRMAQMPLSSNYFANQLANSKPKAESDLVPNLAQNASNIANQTTPKEAPNQTAQNDSVLAQILSESPSEAKKQQETNKSELPKNEVVTTKSEIKNDSAKSDKNGDSPNNGKNVAQNSTKDSSQNAQQTLDVKTPETKIAESKVQENSKMPDSKMLETKIVESKIEQPKTEQSPKNDTLNTQPNSDLKPASFKIGANEQKILNSKGESNTNQNTTQTNNEQSVQNQNNITNAESAQKAEQLGTKLFDSRETMRHFAHNLRTEIQNYKPPLSRITLELQPSNLGSVEVSIISQGKNIQIQLHAPQNTLNLFIQNQSDLRTALSQIGYENVAMSFSNGSQMGFSDNSGKWRYESNANKFRNNFGLKGLDDNQDENEVFEIMITNNYA